MIIYKDILTNDELFTDSNKVNLVDDCIYEVECHFISRKHGDIQLDGANPSAEEGDLDAGTDEVTESGLDLVLNQGLVKTSFDTKSYMLYLKGYAKSLAAKWKELEFTDAQIEESKGKLLNAVKLVKDKLKEAEFYMGVSCNPDGMVAVLDYRQMPDGNEKPIMIFYKQGLDSEKV